MQKDDEKFFMWRSAWFSRRCKLCNFQIIKVLYLCENVRERNDEYHCQGGGDDVEQLSVKHE